MTIAEKVHKLAKLKKKEGDPDRDFEVRMKRTGRKWKLKKNGSDEAMNVDGVPIKPGFMAIWINGEYVGQINDELMVTVSGQEDIDIEEKEAYISREIGAVIIDYETNKFYETNDTGTRIVQLLRESKAAEEIIAAICQEYEVDSETAQTDLDEFFEKLRKYKLVEE